MPKDLPKAAELWEGEVSFFSIDTDLIQSAGYNFDEGALHQLPAQLPTAMGLQLTDIVAAEVVNHQMVPVLKAIEQFKAASKTFVRKSIVNMDVVDQQFAALNVDSAARALFRENLLTYARKCRGDILPIKGPSLAEDMFNLYFNGEAPFELRADKKNEFPDAANLLILENFAKNGKTKGIIASQDGGVGKFADNSDFLYRVKSIDELAALFAATSEHANKIKARLLEVLTDQNSPLHDTLNDAVENHVRKSRWHIGELLSSTVSRVEGYIYEQEVEDFELGTANAEIWQDANQAGVWLVELTVKATCKISVEVTWYVFDYIDRDEMELHSAPVYNNVDIKFKIYLGVSGIGEANVYEDWDVAIDVAPGNYRVNVGEVEPDLSDENYEE